MTQALSSDGPAPIYASDRVAIFLAKAEDVLPGLPTESFDLVLTDPPYGVSFNSNFRSDRFGEIENDKSADRNGIRSVLAECVRLVGQNRHLYVFGPGDVLEGLKVGERANLVWDKCRPGAGNLSAPWAPAHEPITFCISKHRHAGQSGKSSPAVRLRKGSVLSFAPPTGRTVRHPNEKPVELLRELIESSSRGGELVLDPYAGIGSTGVAAVYSGRKAVLIECDPKWATLLVERIKMAESIADRMASETGSTE